MSLPGGREESRGGFKAGLETFELTLKMGGFSRQGKGGYSRSLEREEPHAEGPRVCSREQRCVGT